MLAYVEGRILLGLVLDAGFGAKWHPPGHFCMGCWKPEIVGAIYIALISFRKNPA